MKIDWQHLKINRETYFSHMFFACTVGFSLGLTGLMFLIHSLLPWIPIPKSLNLEETAQKLQEWNHYTVDRKER